jgi:hypothetical protein
MLFLYYAFSGVPYMADRGAPPPATKVRSITASCCGRTFPNGRLSLLARFRVWDFRVRLAGEVMLGLPFSSRLQGI